MNRLEIYQQIILISIGFWLFALIHSVTAADRVKSKIIAAYPKIKKHYRWIYNFKSTVLFFLLYWFLPPNGELLYRFDGWAEIALRIGQIISLIGLVHAFRAFDGKEFLGIPSHYNKSDSSASFISTGYFRFVRHPLYAFIILFLVLEPTMRTGKLIYTINFISYFIVGTFVEERRLARQFGQRFLDYKAQVPRLIPSPFKIKRQIRESAR